MQNKGEKQMIQRAGSFFRMRPGFAYGIQEGKDQVVFVIITKALYDQFAILVPGLYYIVHFTSILYFLLLPLFCFCFGRALQRQYNRYDLLWLKTAGSNGMTHVLTDGHAVEYINGIQAESILQGNKQ